MLHAYVQIFNGTWLKKFWAKQGLNGPFFDFYLRAGALPWQLFPSGTSMDFHFRNTGVLQVW
jgi:hypothetical protein